MSGLPQTTLNQKIKKKCKTNLLYNHHRSPGYGLSLVGETTNSFFLSADIVNITDNEEQDVRLSPEDLARKCAMKLLDEVFYVNFD